MILFMNTRNKGYGFDTTQLPSAIIRVMHSVIVIYYFHFPSDGGFTVCTTLLKFDISINCFLFYLKSLVKKTSLAGSVRSVAFSPDGSKIGVGMKNGEFAILNANSLQVLGKKRDRHQAIHDLRYIRILLSFIHCDCIAKHLWHASEVDFSL